ncbi:MAG: penicillin-binding protein 2 [Bryobacteraceae bacterium]
MSLLPLESETPRQARSGTAGRDDPKFASGRIAVFQYVVAGIFLFLVSGFWELQVQNPDFYNERADRNRIKALPVLAPRGKILDRDGRVVVDNHSSFTLILSRENLKQEHLRPIAEGLNLDYTELVKRVERFKSRPKYEPVVIKEEMTPADLAFVESHRDPEFFPEMEVIHAQRRLYPRDGFAAHLIGYTSEVSEAELDTAELALYEQGDVIGKAGLERQYNDSLRGIDGQRRVIVDNRGREREAIGVKQAIPGKNLQLTLDLDLQSVAELAMEGKKGAVVALDPRNGEVLAMVSRPTFDPNKFAGRIRSADWRDLVGNPDNPLLNRATQAQLAPGSTFKPLMALAGLETGEVDDSWSVGCGGGASFYGHYHRCWRAHGRVAFHRALVESCDVYFYNVGNRLGIDRIAWYAEQAGFGRKTGIDLPHEADGLVPSTRWKIRTFRQKWYPGETISVSIGQGALIVTPLQLAYAIGGIARGGRWYKPHLKKRDKPELVREVQFDPENVRKVVQGMWGVVNEAGGTGGRVRLAGFDVCGKTGTAQLASERVLQSSTGRNMKHNAWFVAFAPRDNPEIVVAVLFEHGEHGHLAAPIAKDILKSYLDKKIRAGVAAPLRSAPVGDRERRAIEESEQRSETPEPETAVPQSGPPQETRQPPDQNP